ncbi:MAG: tetratricopeptide repeat protein [Acidobacteria bacterium]|nr:tetratricopeptide repeat protein [Acidobacteriota bacterium]MCI0568590.1 tetratricopeptide repeat protein [Acidobacteriota bacterium]
MSRLSSLVVPTFLVLLLGSSARSSAQGADTAPPVLDAVEEYPLINVSKERIADVGYWQESLAASPDDVTLQLALGNAYAMNRRFQEAIREYEQLLRVYPESKAAWNNLGSAYRGLGKMSDALNAYKKAVDRDPRYGLAYYNIGAVYDHMGYYDKALKNYSVAIRFDPTLTDSKRNPQVVTNKRLYAVLLQNYVESAGSLALPLEPAYPENPKE